MQRNRIFKRSDCAINKRNRTGKILKLKRPEELRISNWDLGTLSVLWRVGWGRKLLVGQMTGKVSDRRRKMAVS